MEVVVSEIIFENDKNGYKVCYALIKAGEVIIVGVLPLVNPGERIVVDGKWVNHPTYGEQFVVENFEKLSPRDINEIFDYLISGLFKGIGKSTAKKIIKLFGEETLDIIREKPDNLIGINGITAEKALEYSEILNAQKDLDEIISLMKDFNINQDIAMRLYKRYGGNVITMLKTDPYFLINETIEIDFKRIDELVKRLAIPVGFKSRVRAGLIHILKKNSLNGNTYILEEDLIYKAAQFLNEDGENISIVLAELLMKKDIFIEKEGNRNKVYLWEYNLYELEIARFLYSISALKCEIEDSELDLRINEYECELDIILTDEQRKAVREGIKSGVLVITGGPGTGKTTIVKFIIGILQKEGLTIKLAAPTGRAAKKLSEASDFEAQTIHRLLEVSYNESEEKQYFKRNRSNPIEADIIIIDEMSMIDVEIMSYLLRAVVEGTRMVFVGDTDQLPSVGPGNVLKDIINSNMIKVIRLNKIFRQAEESMIIVNAHRINCKELPILNVKDRGFYFISCDNEDNTVDVIKSLIQQRIPGKYGYDPFKDIQILTPMRKGVLGVINLNEIIQEVLNPSKKGQKTMKFYNEIYRLGDRVMQNKNDYNLMWEMKDSGETGYDVYNGDTGKVFGIDNESKVVSVLFDDNKIVNYDYTNLREIEKSYAITVHKSQGSEYPVVIIPLFKVPYMLMTKNILYTAITRAKDIVVIVGDRNTIYSMMNNDMEIIRNTSLKEKLENASRN